MIKRTAMAAAVVAFVCAGAAQAAVIGSEGFAYGDGPIAGQTGGTGFDYDNTSATHTGTVSDWDNAFGAPNVSGGTLVTSGSGAYREYNGPTEGVGSEASPTDERLGAFRGTRVTYYKFTYNTSTTGDWAGLSAFDFGAEKMFFGKPGGDKFAVQQSGVGTTYSTVTVVPNQTYTLVVEQNYDRDRATIWIDPGAADKTSPDARRAFTISNWNSKIRLASGGSNTTIYDDLVIATTFGQALGSDLVFAEDFDNAPNGTVVKNTAPDVGTDWSQTLGTDVTMNNGGIDTNGAARGVFGDFTRALAAGEILVLDFETNDTDGDFHSSDFAGISLFAGASEKVFIGDRGGSTTAWGLQHNGTDGTSSVSGETQNGQFTYNYDTGAYELSFDGTTALSGTATIEMPIDRLRIMSGDGGAIAVDSVEVAIIPEPATLALAAMGLLGLRKRRRR